MTKIAAITGGSSGLGFAFAEILGKQGYDIVILARNKQRIDNAVEELTKKNYMKVLQIYLSSDPTCFLK